MIPATVFWGLLSEYYEKSEIQDIIPAFFRLFSFPNLLVIAGFPLLIAYIDKKKKSPPAKRLFLLIL